MEKFDSLKDHLLKIKDRDQLKSIEWKIEEEDVMVIT
jgi:hypothetical protein